VYYQGRSRVGSSRTSVSWWSSGTVSPVRASRSRNRSSTCCARRGEAVPVRISPSAHRSLFDPHDDVCTAVRGGGRRDDHRLLDDLDDPAFGQVLDTDGLAERDRGGTFPTVGVLERSRNRRTSERASQKVPDRRIRARDRRCHVEDVDERVPELEE
jgi:hypothetical protein